MQFSAVLNIFIVKTYINSIFLKMIKKNFFSKNVHSYRLSLFKNTTLSCAIYRVSFATDYGNLKR